MNEDIQNEMEVTPVPNQGSAEVTSGKSDIPTDKILTKKKVNYKKLFIVSLLLVLVWAVIIVAYLMYFKPVDNTTTDNNDSTPLPTATVLPTVTFELYSDDYLEFEHPAGADVLVEGQRIYHPSGPGKSINGVAYMSITVEESFKLEMYHFLNGGDFAYQTYNPVTMTLTDFITDLNPAPEVTQVKTELTVEPTITKLNQIDGYLVKFVEQKMMLLMSLNDEGVYESVNYGLWEDLDFLGSFAGNGDYVNFIGLTCEIENESDYVMCEELTTRFLDSVEKKFDEDEQFEVPKLETTLELRDPETAELIDKYRFYFDNFDEGTYLNSSWNSFSVHNGQTRLGLSVFEPTTDYADISFSDLRDTIPTPDIQTTQVFSNLLRGEHKVAVGGQVSKYFTYSMYYPDPDKTECYKLERPGVDVENYVGCTSYKLKLKGIDASIQATCNYSPDLPDSWNVCDEMIKELKVEKL